MNPCHGYRRDLRDLRYPLGCAALGFSFFFLFIYLCVLSLFMEILPFSLPSSLNVPGAYPGRPSGAGFELIACTGAMGYCSGRVEPAITQPQGEGYTTTPGISQLFIITFLQFLFINKFSKRWEVTDWELLAPALFPM